MLLDKSCNPNKLYANKFVFNLLYKIMFSFVLTNTKIKKKKLKSKKKKKREKAWIR